MIMIIQKILIDGVDYSEFLPYPTKITLTRDESLDTIMLQLIETPLNLPFKPLSKAQFIAIDNSIEKTFFMAVAGDKVEETIQNSTYTHNLTLIEETKCLERLQIGGKTFTNPTSSYFENSIQIEGVFSYTTIGTSVSGQGSVNYPYNIDNKTYPNVFTPINFAKFTIMSPLAIIYTAKNCVATKIILYRGGVAIWNYSNDDVITTRTPLEEVDIAEAGKYRLHYETIAAYETANSQKYSIDFEFYKTNNPVLFASIDFNVNEINIPQDMEGVGILPGGDTQPVPVGFEVQKALLNRVLTPIADKVTIFTGEEEIVYIPTNEETGGIPLVNSGTKYLIFERDGKSFIYFIQVATQEEIEKKKTNKTITEVINGVLSTFNTLYMGETPTITFDEEQAQKYAGIEAPQLSFTNQMSLWEVFSIVGDVIHGIPRLQNGVLSFDLLGEVNQSQFDFENYVVNEQNQSVEQFCSDIISTINNCVNYSQDGSISEPDAENFKTLRIESGLAYLEEGELLIQTQYPIEKLIKVECGKLKDGTKVGDITSNVWEKSEYNVLSSYSASYPNSKCYAIYWERGQKDIKGLSFKKPNIFSSAFENYAIQNIICKVTGKKNSWFDTLFGKDEVALQNLMFKVAYIPRVNIKAKQTKTNVEDLKITSQLAYNQNSTLIDSEAFGESMKGAIARMGNIDIVRTFIFNNLAEIPQIGDFVKINNDDYYLTNLIAEIYQDFIQCQIAFSKDFNRLNEYVGIKNELRFYEVAIDQCLDRYVSTEDFCVIGDEIETDNKTVIQRMGVNEFSDTFIPKGTRYTIDETHKQSTALVSTSNDNENYSQYELPIISYGLGNSSVYNFAFQDNFAVGDQIVEISTEASAGTPNRVQQAVQYGDAQGEVEYLKFGMLSTMPRPGTDSYEDRKKFGDALPELIEQYTPTFFQSPVMLLKKDNRENIKINYQINFVTNKKSLVIGSGLASKNRLISNVVPNVRLYVSPNRVNKFAKSLDITSMTEFELNYAEIDRQKVDETKPIAFNLSTFTSTIAGKSWLLINENNGKYELILGENIDIEPNQEIKLPTFTFTHKILTN